MDEKLIPDDLKEVFANCQARACYPTEIVDDFLRKRRSAIVNAQQDIIKGFIKLAKLSEGYRQHDAFEAICTLFNQTYDSFMDSYNKKSPLPPKSEV